MLLLVIMIFLEKGNAFDLNSLIQNWNTQPWKFLPNGKAEWVFCQMSPDVIDAVTDSHNEFRANVAKRNLNTAVFGTIPGSKTLFKLKYDCTHEQLARGTIGKNCEHSSIYMNKIGRGENFIMFKLAQKPNVAEQKFLFAWAVKNWMNTVTQSLSSDVVYTYTSMEPFANMIYNKTLKFGCSFLFCDETKRIALACVYDNRPKIGEPLYWADSQDSIGCQTDESCKKVIKGRDVNCDNLFGLCDQDPSTLVGLQEGGKEEKTEEREEEEDDDDDDDDDDEREAVARFKEGIGETEEEEEEDDSHSIMVPAYSFIYS